MKGTLIALALAAVLPATASADNLDYSYLEAGLSHSSVLDFSGGNGHTLDGAYALTPSLFLDGSIEHSSFDDHTIHNFFGTAFSIGRITLDRDTAHLGMHFPMNEDMDLLFRIGMTRLTVDSAIAPDNSHSSLDVGLGMRADLGANLEFEADIGQDQAGFGFFESSNLLYVSATDGNDTYLNATLRYRFTDRFLLGLGYGQRQSSSANGAQATNLHTWLLSARWAF